MATHTTNFALHQIDHEAGSPDSMNTVWTNLNSDMVAVDSALPRRGCLALVSPTNEAIELKGGMNCIGDTDLNSVKLGFRASDDADSVLRTATNKTWRVGIEYYDGAGGSTAAISGASNASPVVITSNGHGLANGQYVYISGLAGVQAALNGKYYAVANQATNTFELAGSTAAGAYVSGGVWNSGVIIARMKNATPADVVVPLTYLENTGKWQLAWYPLDITARCQGDYTSNGNADLLIEGDIAGLDGYIRAVSLANVETKAQLIWVADPTRPFPISSALLSQGALVASYEINHINAANYTTNSTSFVDADATNLRFLVRTSGGTLIIQALAIVSFAAANSVQYDISIDGVRQGGTLGSSSLYMGTASVSNSLSMTLKALNVPAGTHDIRLVWKVGGSTCTMLSSATAPVRLYLEERKN